MSRRLIPYHSAAPPDGPHFKARPGTPTDSNWIRRSDNRPLEPFQISMFRHCEEERASKLRAFQATHPRDRYGRFTRKRARTRTRAHARA